MAYNNNYKFTRPFTKNGKESKWHQVVEFIKLNGPISKREIAKAIWNYTGDTNVRGYQSSLFAQLNEIQPEGVHYDKKLKKWTTYNATIENNYEQDLKDTLLTGLIESISNPSIIDSSEILYMTNKYCAIEIGDIISAFEKYVENFKKRFLSL